MSRLAQLTRGLAALIVLAALVVGVPWFLLVFVGNPYPPEGVAWDAPLTDNAVLGLFAVIAWVFWAQMLVCVVLEAAGAIRGTHLGRVPFAFGGQQQFAHVLINTVLTIAITGPVVATASSATAASAAAEPTTVTATSAPGTVTANDAQSARQQGRHRVVTVEDGDTLWSLAQAHLGAGERWKDIARLNDNEPMNDGGTFRAADHIRPGWQLSMPEEATGLPWADSASTAGEHHTTVQPGDSLSQIAAHEYGDPAEWKRIWDANRDQLQNDGARFTNPSLIQPGWQLKVPQTHPKAHEADHRRPPTRPTPEGDQSSPRHLTSDDTKHQSAGREDSGAERSPESAPGSGQTHRAVPASPKAGVDDQHGAADAGESSSGDQDSNVLAVTAAGLGMVLAAGVIGFVSRRRRQQQRHRPIGAQIAMPEGPAAEAEVQLRTASGHQWVELVDLALRMLAQRCATTRIPLPMVRLARLTHDQFELYLAEPSQLPEPFSATEDPSVWILRQDQAEQLRANGEQLRDTVVAPYPALVALGSDAEGGHIMVDLEQAGTLGVVGDADLTRHILAALAIELGTSLWADDLQVSIVGGFEDLGEALNNGRFYHGDVEPVLAKLEAAAAAERETLTHAGVDDVGQARLGEVADGLWAPEIVVVVGALDERQRERINRVVDQVPRVAVAALTQSEPAGEWSLHASAAAADTSEPEAVLAPVGVRITPQRVDDHMYRQVVSIAATANDTTDHEAADGPREIRLDDLGEAPVPQGETSTDHSDDVQSSGEGESEDVPVPPELVDPAAPPAVLVLGPVEVVNAKGSAIDPGRRPRAMEIAAYLALMPGRGLDAFYEVISPGRRRDQMSSTPHKTRLNELRKLLGNDPGGHPYLPRGVAKFVGELHPDVRTDWGVWQELVGDDPRSASTADLARALGLARGRPFEGVDPDRYAWAQVLLQTMISQIVDVSYELARRHLEQGDWQEAQTAAAQGLMCEPGMERLHRVQIMAAYAAKNMDGVRERIARMRVILEEVGDGKMERATADLINQLMEHTSREEVVGNELSAV